MLNLQQINVKNLSTTENVCAQILREVERQPNWSMAHVIMNPLSQSLLHQHRQMTEIYVITKGYGELGIGHSLSDLVYYQVTAGNVVEIPPQRIHILKNKSSTHLEHLVFALPPFSPADVQLIDQEPIVAEMRSLPLPVVEDCFDGAKILSYNFPHLNLSIAFGWVPSDPTRHKQPHYHQKIIEFAYVVDGQGFIKINQIPHPIRPSDWLCIHPETKHGFLNEATEDLVVVCICSPAFQMEDVHY